MNNDNPPVAPNIKPVANCVPVPIVSVPDCVPELLSQTKDGSKTKKDVHVSFLKETNWITPSLKAEIQSLCPVSSNIVDQKLGVRDSTKFRAQCRKLFPSGRVFASSI